MPLIKSFRKAAMEDYDILWNICSQWGENSCQHSFVNLFTLNEKYGSEIFIDDDVLHIHRAGLDSDTTRTYLFPIGKANIKKAVERIIRDAHFYGKKARFETITEKDACFLDNAFPNAFEIEENRDYAEYIYLSEKMALLPGKALYRRRHDLMAFKNEYGRRSEIISITRGNIGDVLEYHKKWMAEFGEAKDIDALRLEYREMEKQFGNFRKLRISGVIVKIDGQTAGFSYGAPISRDCFDALVEKGDLKCRHIYRALFQETAKLCVGKYKYINREEDAGVSGLRQAKLSYKPDILLRKFTAQEY